MGDAFDFGGSALGAPLGGTSKAERAQMDLAQQLADLAGAYWVQTDPTRQRMLQEWQDFQLGGYNPTASPIYRAGRQSLEDQTQASRQNLLSTMASGGALGEGLYNLEASRSRGLGDLAAQVSQDVANKMYGAAWGAPSQTFSGLTGSGQVAAPVIGAQGQKTSTAMNAASNICCFIFIAGHGGSLHPVARRYRDEHMTARNRRGYYRLADRIVPAMARHGWVMRLVKMAMVAPMTSYGKYRYGYNRIGAVYAPISALWLAIFTLMGGRAPYRRKGTLEVV